ncbi:hypothetical protein J6590_026582 [Homalodisca vitripennis]|nr:hypothetical protein J6590_026582 [Homalodisca vitripennis]
MRGPARSPSSTVGFKWKRADETYFHSSSAVSKTWTERKTKGLKNPISKGKRVIVLHAGSEDGFIPNAWVMFESGKKTAKEKFDSVSEDEWKTRCEHVKKVEEEYLRHERIIDDVTERFIISLGEENESEGNVSHSEGSDADCSDSFEEQITDDNDCMAGITPLVDD